MAYTWGQAHDEMGRLLKDVSDTAWSSELRLDGFNAALAAFAFHTAVATSTPWTADGVESSFAVPDNAVEGLSYLYLWDETEEVWWRPVRLQPGSVTPDPTPLATSEEMTYYEWPTGTISLGKVPAAGDFLIYYYAHYDPVVDDDSVIAVPLWAREALLHYGGAYCVRSASISRASIAQWNQKQDSGNPDHNPFLKPIDMFMNVYKRILAEHNAQQKAPPYLGLRP